MFQFQGLRVPEGLRLQSKNTFIDVVFDAPQHDSRRRAKSADCRSGCSVCTGSDEEIDSHTNDPLCYSTIQPPVQARSEAPASHISPGSASFLPLAPSTSFPSYPATGMSFLPGHMNMSVPTSAPMMSAGELAQHQWWSHHLVVLGMQIATQQMLNNCNATGAKANVTKTDNGCSKGDRDASCGIGYQRAAGNPPMKKTLTLRGVPVSHPCGCMLGCVDDTLPKTKTTVVQKKDMLTLNKKGTAVLSRVTHRDVLLANLTVECVGGSSSDADVKYVLKVDVKYAAEGVFAYTLSAGKESKSFVCAVRGSPPLAYTAHIGQDSASIDADDAFVVDGLSMGDEVSAEIYALKLSEQHNEFRKVAKTVHESMQLSLAQQSGGKLDEGQQQKLQRLPEVLTELVE